MTACLLMTAGIQLRPPPAAPALDAEGYARLALGLSEFGVFGYFSTPRITPSLNSEVVPLYPALLAGLIKLDPNLRHSLICQLSTAADRSKNCARTYATVQIAQGLLMALFFLSVWVTAWLFSRRRLLAWCAMLLAWFSGMPTDYANLFLTEALVLPLFGLLTVCMTLVYLHPEQRRWIAGGGLTLGLLALTRPSFSFLFWFLMVSGLLTALLPCNRKLIARGFFYFVVGYTLVTTPWMARNYYQFDRIMLSGGQYGARTLAQRVSYNNMTPIEWGVAFIYWFPDIGDSLAKSLFPVRFYQRLGWGSGSFYLAGATKLADAVNATRHGTDDPVAYMLTNDIISHPFKHALVTLPLMWRGMFIRKYWSIFGWICSLWLLVRTLRSRRYGYAFIWAPGFFMLGFHAAVSVSIARYNIILIPALAIGLAYVLLDIFDRRVGVLGHPSDDTEISDSELYAIPTPRD